jgi:AraC-like DNA-binding protein
MVDMRRGRGNAAGSYCHEGAGLATGWHAHDLHQLEYAIAGLVEVEDSSGHYLLPPHQAAWIPAGALHESTLHTSVRTVSVFFLPELIPEPGTRVRILAVAPLIREMITYAIRWPITRTGSDPLADDYFRTLAQLVGETLEHEAPLRLPTCSDPVVSAAMAYTQEYLRMVTVSDVAHAVGVSERTLRRRFHAQVGLSWRSYLLQARLLRAMALLARPEPSILQVALDVGFNSVNAFGRAFLDHSGETASAYRRRLNLTVMSPAGPTST